MAMEAEETATAAIEERNLANQAEAERMVVVAMVAVVEVMVRVVAASEADTMATAVVGQEQEVAEMAMAEVGMVMVAAVMVAVAMATVEEGTAMAAVGRAWAAAARARAGTVVYRSAISVAEDTREGAVMEKGAAARAAVVAEQEGEEMAMAEEAMAAAVEGRRLFP